MGSRWPLSHSPLFDLNGLLASGALITFYEAGTTTPMTVYRDADETTPHASPVVATAVGIAPLIFVPYCSYGVRVTTAAGALMFAEDGVPNPAPPEAGGGGGVSVATEQILQTGDPIWRLRTGTMAGFVRMNGRTIGNASSGATERANADTAALYTFLWDNLADAICPVAGGRGASAAADFAASKVITLPDMRGRGPFGLDDMGNSAAGRLSMIADWGVGNSTTIGSSGGAAMHTLATAEMPSHSHSGTTSTNGAHWHTYETAPQTVGIGGGFPGFTAGWTTMATSTTGDHNHVLLINNAGGGGAHNNMPPFALGTWFLKL